jgi:hypothetical protein
MAAATKTKAAAATRAAQRAPEAPRAPAPEAVAMPPPPSIPEPTKIRVPEGRAVAIGRDGRPVWRHTAQVGADQFAIDPAIVDHGWVYEWKRYSVVNQVDHAYLARLKRAGWAEVPAERHDGLFLPPGTTGSVIIDGLILMECPIELYREAQDDVRKAANDVMRKARAERGLQVPGGVTGISTETPAARAASYVNVTRAFASAEDKEALAGIPRPAYDYNRDSID